MSVDRRTIILGASPKQALNFLREFLPGRSLHEDSRLWILLKESAVGWLRPDLTLLVDYPGADVTAGGLYRRDIEELLACSGPFPVRVMLFGRPESYFWGRRVPGSAERAKLGAVILSIRDLGRRYAASFEAIVKSALDGDGPSIEALTTFFSAIRRDLGGRGGPTEILAAEEDKAHARRWQATTEMLAELLEVSTIDIYEVLRAWPGGAWHGDTRSTFSNRRGRVRIVRALLAFGHVQDDDELRRVCRWLGLVSTGSPISSPWRGPPARAGFASVQKRALSEALLLWSTQGFVESGRTNPVSIMSASEELGGRDWLDHLLESMHRLTEHQSSQTVEMEWASMFLDAVSRPKQWIYDEYIQYHSWEPKDWTTLEAWCEEFAARLTAEERQSFEAHRSSLVQMARQVASTTVRQIIDRILKLIAAE